MNYIKIDSNCMNNGEGIRVVLWLGGCSHFCEGCHNIEVLSKDAGVLFDNKAKEELFSYLSNDYIQGLTLSGGDPLFKYNIDSVIELAKEVKLMFPTKDIWLWTGYKFNTIKQEVLDTVDVILDGKYKRDLPTKKKWRGSDNQCMYKKNSAGQFNKID
ncbi:MAG: anaerobic ribonucleoside-triphosphate reductase activating protein [Fusobacteriaceae bacterium]